MKLFAKTVNGVFPSDSRHSRSIASGSYKPGTYPHLPRPTHTNPFLATRSQKKSHSPTPTHTQPKEGETPPHSLTPSQKKITPTHTHPKKVTLNHTHPHPAKKRSYPPTHSQIKVTNTHTNPHPSKKWSHSPTHNWRKECHMSNTWYMCEKYSLFKILAGFFIFEKYWPVKSFSSEYFWNSIWIYCLFVCFQQLANYISENSKVKVRNAWNIFVFFHVCYFFCIMHNSRSSTCDSDNNTK